MASPPKKLAPLPESSISAVLEHREELALTADQIAKLEELDRKRELDNEQIRKAREEAPPPKAKEENRRSDPGMGGMGRRGGMGGMGGMGRRGMGFGGPSSTGSAKSEQLDPRSPEFLMQRIDDNDTASYLEAEKVLTEEQRSKARAIAEQYREALWDRRQGRDLSR